MGRYADSATARQLIAEHRRALAHGTDQTVRDTAAVLAGALLGDALGAGLRLVRHAPTGLDPADQELYSAAISITSALWHIETGTDAGGALGCAASHLSAAQKAVRIR